MRIQYMSDLHMELWDNSRYIRANEFEVVGDVLVLAGDTFYLRDTVAPHYNEHLTNGFEPNKVIEL